MVVDKIFRWNWFQKEQQKRNSRHILPPRRVQRSRQLAPRCLAGTPRNRLGRRPLRTGCPGEGNKLILNLQTIYLHNRRNLVYLFYDIAIGHLISLVFSNYWISIYKYALQCNNRQQRHSTSMVGNWYWVIMRWYWLILNGTALLISIKKYALQWATVNIEPYD